MPPKKRARATRTEEEAASQETRTRAKRPRTRNSQEDEEDSGQENRRFHQFASGHVEDALKQERERSKAFMNKFGKRIKSEADEVLNVLGQKNEEDRATARGNTSKILEACENLTGKDASIGSFLPSGTPPLLLQKTKTIVKICHDVLALYGTIEESCGKHALEFPKEVWKQDQKDIEEILENSKNSGEVLIETHVVPMESINLPSAIHAKHNEGGSHAIDLFAKSRTNLERETWGQAARAQVRALTVMIATLPITDQEND